VWEVKHLKKDDEGQLPAKKEEALTPLQKYRRSDQFRRRTDVKYAALLFTGKDRYEIVDLQDA